MLVGAGGAVLALELGRRSAACNLEQTIHRLLQITCALERGVSAGPVLEAPRVSSLRPEAEEEPWSSGWHRRMPHGSHPRLLSQSVPGRLPSLLPGRAGILNTVRPVGNIHGNARPPCHVGVFIIFPTALSFPGSTRPPLRRAPWRGPS